MALVMGIVLGSMRRYYPPSILGLGYWALTPVAWLIAAGLFAYAGDWLDTRRLVGNFPQAFSHVALLNSAANLSKHHGPASQRASSANDAPSTAPMS